MASVEAESRRIITTELEELTEKLNEIMYDAQLFL